MSEYLTIEQIESALAEIGETGNYKVDGENLLIQSEENANWRFCGAVKDPEDVYEFFRHDEFYERSSW